MILNHITRRFKGIQVMIGTSIKHKDRIISIISMFCPHAKIYLFGSYARGDYSRSSDIDIAIDNGEPISLVEMAQMAHMIDVLNLIQKVEVIDFRSVPLLLQQKILKEGIAWKD